MMTKKLQTKRNAGLDAFCKTSVSKAQPMTTASSTTTMHASSVSSIQQA